jgi:MazG family protein
MSDLARLVSIVARLRGPDGCPWDRAQTLSTMRPYLLEECHEVLDAIDAGLPGAVAEELGDLLFVVVLLAQMGESLDGEPFDIDGVARRIGTKMVARHPHVFGTATRPEGPGSGIAAWEAEKAKEGEGGRPRSRLAGVPRSLPALLRTHRQSEKAASVGFDWPDASGVLAKVHEELAELNAAVADGDPDAVEHEYGDVLMALGSLGRHIGAPAESALRRANDRFAHRFQTMEAIAWQNGTQLADLNDAQLDALWEQAKRAPSHTPDGG